MVDPAAAVKLNGRVVSRMLLHPDLFIIKVAPIGWTIPDFQPGQYLALGLPRPAEPTKLNQRAYSIASPPRAKDAFEFYIALVRTGLLTPSLYALKEGDELWVSNKIVGHFTFDGIPDDANVVLVATGTGIAPYMSMVRNGLLENTKRKIAIFHGVRETSDLGYRELLMELAAKHKNFAYIPTISRKEGIEGYSGRKGYVQDIWTDRVLEKMWGTKLAPSNTHIFLCGNPAMIDGFEKLLQSEGYVEHSRRTPGQIHVERYW